MDFSAFLRLMHADYNDYTHITQNHRASLVAVACVIVTASVGYSTRRMHEEEGEKDLTYN